MTSPRVVVIEDDESVREALVSTLDEAGYEVVEVEGVTHAEACIARHQPDAVLLDIRLRDGDGLTLLEELRARHPKLPIIMTTAYTDSERIIRAMSLGAFEYIAKPFDIELLLATIARATQASPQPRATVPAPSADFLIGSSAIMLPIWKAIGRAASTNAPVLITGESGVGKELIAQAIHQHGGSKGPFIAANVAALSPTLLESELFGHEKGAFTGAVSRREGRFEVARGGTLFLDEIGDLELHLQTRLLRVLETGRFERVGGSATVETDARIIAATSRIVDPRASGATLREDLYYRLSVIHIHVPPLREHPQDIPLLVDAFLRRCMDGSFRALSAEAMRALVAYPWPGNVRELKHTIESACIMSRAEIIERADLNLPAPAARAAGAELASEDLNLARHIEATERRVITRALEVAQGNRAKAARLLGIRRALLYDRLKALNLS